MKYKFCLPILILFTSLFILPEASLLAQYSIPSYDVELTQANTTFEEDGIILLSAGLEERQVIVEVEDDNPSQSTWAIVKVFSLDGQDELGPYTVNEGTQLRVTIDEREWGVKVISFLPGCIISTWIE